MKLVIDCNVMISAGLNNGVCRRVISDIIKNHDNFISDQIILEYKNVILRPKFKKYYNLLFELFQIICEKSTWIIPITSSFILPDKDDKIYLDTAITARANFLITGNIKDYPNKEYNEVKIITPKEYSSFINE